MGAQILLNTLLLFNRPVHERELIISLGYRAGLDFKGIMASKEIMAENLNELRKFGYLQQEKAGWFSMPNHGGFNDSNEEQDITEASFRDLWGFMNHIDFNARNVEGAVPRFPINQSEEEVNTDTRPGAVLQKGRQAAKNPKRIGLVAASKPRFKPKIWTNLKKLGGYVRELLTLKR